MVEVIPYRNEIIEAIKMLYNFIAMKWLKQYLIGGILLDRLILKTILQTNTVLKLMRYLASSLPVTSSIKKSMRGILAWRNLNHWNSYLVETSYTKFLNSHTSGANTHIEFFKKINLAFPLKYGYSVGFFFFFFLIWHII